MNWLTMSYDERIAFVDQHASRIAVRAHVDGGWKSLFLTELPDKLRKFETHRLAARNVEPVRFKDNIT